MLKVQQVEVLEEEVFEDEVVAVEEVEVDMKDKGSPTNQKLLRMESNATIARNMDMSKLTVGTKIRK